jgi:BMFP domain-containing protein YqiC
MKMHRSKVAEVLEAMRLGLDELKRRVATLEARENIPISSEDEIHRGQP